MKYSFIDRCKELLNEVTDEIKGNDRYYNLRKICLADYTKEDEKLILPIGRCDNGEYIFMNFEEVASLFITGTTGTGKSIFIDSLIVSLMLKNTSSDVKLFLFDPKQVELGEYNGIKYVETKENIKNISSAKKVLLNILKEMELRTNKLIETHHRSIKTYNKYQMDKWPHLFIFIDEACDLLKNNDIKKIFIEIMEYGKPLGIHLILATNSYLKELKETGFIDHFKYRMSFDLTSKEQAEYIDIKGSNLLNDKESYIKGNNQKYKFLPPYVSTDEIARVVLEIGKKKK